MEDQTRQDAYEAAEFAIDKMHSTSLNLEGSDNDHLTLVGHRDRSMTSPPSLNTNGMLRDPTTSFVSYGEESHLKTKSPQTSNIATMMHLLKGNIGTGVLALPCALTHAGLGVGTAFIPIIGIISIHCMHMLVDCSKMLCKTVGAHSLDYPSTAELAFKCGPESTKFLSTAARFLVNTMLLITQFGFCCAYILFVATSVETVLQEINYYGLSQNALVGIIIPLMILYNAIRNLKQLTFFSTIANIIQSVGIVIVLVSLCNNLPPTWTRPVAKNITAFPTFFGTAMYAFEGIGVILPLENEMATPEAFGGLNGVMNTGMMIVLCLYTAMAFYGYLKYGDAVKPSITLNLPETLFYQIVKLMFALAIFLSYALQAYVPFNIMWPFVTSTLRKHNFVMGYWTEFSLNLLFKGLVVAFTGVLAIVIPNLDDIISLVGALASSSLALMFPPLLQILVYSKEPMSKTKWRWMLTKDILICVFGFLGFLTGTTTSVQNIIANFHKKKQH